MFLHYECMMCQLENRLRRAALLEGDLKRAKYMQALCGVFARANPEHAGPALVEALDGVDAAFGLEKADFEDLKRQYGDMMMGLMPELRTWVARSSDPLAAALKLSRAGNYIDFGIQRTIDDARLMQLLEKAEGEILDEEEYRHLRCDLAQAHSLAFLTDNCGEIVLDALVLECLRARYPDLKLTVITRGAPVSNDATLADALSAGLDRYARVMDSGSNVAGTQIALISDAARHVLEHSDLIIAKGMGNFETLGESGLNVYYLFLCKCDFFSKRLKVPMLAGVMLNDLRLPESWLRG